MYAVADLKKLFDLVKFVIFTLVFRVHMAFHILIKGYTVPESQGTHDMVYVMPFYNIYRGIYR